MEGILKPAALFADEDQYLDYIFEELSNHDSVPASPSDLSPPGSPSGFDYEPFTAFDLTPPVTEPASPVRPSFSNSPPPNHFHPYNDDALPFFTDNMWSVVSTPPSPLDDNDLLTPVTSSPPAVSPLLKGLDSTKLFPTLFLGGDNDDAYSDNKVRFRPAVADSDEEEVDIESVNDAAAQQHVKVSKKTTGLKRSSMTSTTLKTKGAIAAPRRTVKRSSTSSAGNVTKKQAQSRKGGLQPVITMAAVSDKESSTSLSDTPGDEEMKRSMHNILERKRREDLKQSFQQLRERVPEIADDERAPKVIILRKATCHIHALKSRQEDIQNEKCRLLGLQQSLRERLARMRY